MKSFVFRALTNLLSSYRVVQELKKEIQYMRRVLTSALCVEFNLMTSKSVTQD